MRIICIAGVGRSLLPGLIDACTGAGYRQMVAYIDAANVPSQRLHETFGFERAGLLKAVGFKYGRWTDSILMQRALGPGGTMPPCDDNGRVRKHAIFPHHIGVKSNRAVLFGFPINPLNLGIEARKQIGAALEHFQIVQHRARALVEPLARHDGGDAWRIDHEQRGGDPPDIWSSGT